MSTHATAGLSALMMVAVGLGACLGERPLGADEEVGGSGGAGGASGAGADGTGGNDSSGAAGSGAGGDAGGVSGLVAARLEFEALPQPAHVSRPLGAVEVRIVDAGGVVVSRAGDTITLNLGNNPGGANLMGYVTAQAQAGVAVFDTLGIDQAGTGYTLTAFTPGLPTASSQPFDVARLPFERVVTGLYGGYLSQIAVSSAEPPSLFAAGPGGVFRSDNGGGSWAAANFGNIGAVGAIAVDPRDAQRVYGIPAFGSLSFPGTGPSVTRSDDGGNAWRPLEALANAGAIDVGAFAIDPLNPSIIYAGGEGGIFRSADAGESWVRTSFAFASFELTIDPITPTTLYASAYDLEAATPQGIYKTVDSGNNWAAVNNPSLPADIIPQGPQALLATPAGIFVNEYRSTDGGASWEAGAVSARAFAYSPANVQRLYAAEGAFVRVSNDGGQTFGAQTSPNALINGLAVDPSDPDHVYAATESGVFASTNAGATWSNVSIGISTQVLYSVAMDSAAPDDVYVGARGGVYVTSNGGVTWPYSQLGTGIDEVTALLVDPSDSAIVYACTSAATFHRSDDRGMNWSPGTDTGGFAACYDIAVSGSTLWLPSAGGIRRSFDGGATWEAQSRLDFASYSVAIAPDGATLYAGSSEGTFKSINQGTDWTLMTLDLADAFLVDPQTPSIVYMGLGCGEADVATGSGGIRRSTDAGESWEPIVAGACMTALMALDDGSIVAVGRGAQNYIVSNDQGVSWQPAGLGIQGDPTDVAASSDGQTLYVPSTLGLYKSVSGGR